MSTDIVCNECYGEGYINSICSACNGSGEGMYDGTSCRECKGGGEVSWPCDKCEEAEDICCEEDE